jgi:hypothetical protein
LLDEAGEAKLRRHLESCAECRAEVAEQKALLSVLHSEPMLEAPRSFALPYAPRTVEAPARGSSPIGLPYAAGAAVMSFSRVLRGLQVATATAALVLVFLVGINIVEGPGALESAGEREIATDQTVRLAETDHEDPSLAPQQEGAEPGKTFTTNGAVTDVSDASEGSSSPPIAEVPQQGALQPTQQPADASRSGLEWALIGMSGFTAILALSVVAATWVPRLRT